MNVSAKRAAFRALHARGCFVIPNPWDVGSARLFQHMGFSALATTSSGFAWTTGRPDYAVTLEDVLEHLATLSAAVDLPLNADFESGFAREPEGVAANVTRAIATGVAGLSVEDRDIDAPGTLYDKAFAVERIAAARAAIDRSGQDVILVARTEGMIGNPGGLNAAIDKLQAFAAAGADCLFAPGVKEKSDIAQMVRAVAPKPLNVLVAQPGLTVPELADLGVRRISVGGGLARAGWGAVKMAAEMLKAGSFEGLTAPAIGKELNGLFRDFAQVEDRGPRSGRN